MGLLEQADKLRGHIRTMTEAAPNLLAMLANRLEQAALYGRRPAPR